jgi:hypothetical protein
MKRLLVCLLLVGVSVVLHGQRTARSDEESEALLKYKEPIDTSIDKALDYLASQQAENGSFPGQYGQTTAVAALSGMAFLSKGYTPGLGPYGENINRCIDYVLSNEQVRDGKPSGYLLHSPKGRMYAHCISTLFLSEVSGMIDPSRQERIDDVLPRALSLILTAQRVPKEARFKGGWRYHPPSHDADLSLTGWAIMALRSARLNGAAIPIESIDNAVGFVIRCVPLSTDREEGFSCKPSLGGKPTMTGVGILCLMLCGRHDDQMLPRAGDYMLAQNLHQGREGNHFFYGIYYGSQASFQLGGKYWDNWATGMYENSLQHQQHRARLRLAMVHALLPGQAKVGQLGNSIFRDQDIRRLDIPVDDSTGMSHLKRIT